MEDAEAAVMEEIVKLSRKGSARLELAKGKKQTESMMAFEDMSVMNRANSLAIYELLGDADLMNNELESIHAVTAKKF